MCSDFRALNSVVKTVTNYLPHCDEMWGKLRYANYISVVDMRHGYWCCLVSKASRRYLGIVTPWGTYRYKVLPMGYINASYVFQKFLKRKLRRHGLLYEQIMVDNTNNTASDNVSNNNINIQKTKDINPNFKIDEPCVA